MTVKELNKQLKNIPDDAIVYMMDSLRPLNLISEHTERGRKVKDDEYPTQFITLQ